MEIVTPILDSLARSEQILSKFIKDLELIGKCDVLQIPAREKFRNIKELLPVLGEYIKVKMDEYEGLLVRTDEWHLLDVIRDFIRDFGVDIAASTDWDRFKEYGRFDGDFEGKFKIVFRDHTKKSKERQFALERIKNYIERFKQRTEILDRHLLIEFFLHFSMLLCVKIYMQILIML